MKRSLFEIEKNIPLTKDVFEMVLNGDTSGITNAGQFVNILLDGYYLRRPISVCDYDEGALTLIYKVVGKGTKAMSEMPVGTNLDLLVGLGNGYDLSKAGDHPLLIGGGVGVPPLYKEFEPKIVAKKAKKSRLSLVSTKKKRFLQRIFSKTLAAMSPSPQSMALMA